MADPTPFEQGKQGSVRPGWDRDRRPPSSNSASTARQLVWTVWGVIGFNVLGGRLLWAERYPHSTPMDIRRNQPLLPRGRSMNPMRME